MARIRMNSRNRTLKIPKGMKVRIRVHEGGKIRNARRVNEKGKSFFDKIFGW